ncbi:MAG: copper resistance protein CopC [Frankiales bacterium]|nr:copper resistance protein CopC [Frankiales bacterium]
MGGVTRHRRRVIVGVLASLATLMLLAAPEASAHAVLQSSTPQSGAVLKPGDTPTRIELEFDEPVEVSGGAIQVVAGDGSRVDTKAVSHPGGAATRVAVGLRTEMPEGSYLVVWRVVSADSHPVHGSFTFAVGHPGAIAAPPLAAESGPLALALGAVRFAGYAGLLLLVGVLVFLGICQPSLWAAPAARRLLALAVLTTAAATVAGFALQAAFDVVGGWSATVDPTALRALLGTRLGHAHLLRLVVLAAVVATVSRRGSMNRLRTILLSAEALGLLVTVAVEGHAGRTPATAALDVAHLAAAGSWLGGLVVLAVVVLPAHRRDVSGYGDELPPPTRPASLNPVEAGAVAVLDRVNAESDSWRSTRRFSALALTSVAVLTATGILQALRQVPEMGALTGTTYGRLLLLKVTLAAATLAIAAVSRSVVHGGLDLRTGKRRGQLLVRAIAAETGVLTAVLVVTSALVATTPAGAAYRPSQERTAHAGPVTLDISAIAPAAHTLDLHLYALGADGLPTDVEQITAEAAPTAANTGLGPVRIPLLQAGTGHFLANRLLLPRKGRWTVTLLVQTGEFDAYTTTTTLTVR